MAKKPRAPQFVSPKGTAIYPWLNKADTEYDADGVYKVTLSIPEDELDKPIKHKLEEFSGRTLRDILDSKVKEAKALALEKAKPADKKKITINPAYEAEVDDDGNETGNVRLSFKMKALVKPKEGDAFTQKPDILDAKRNKVDVQIWGGSILRVVFGITPYYVAGTKCAGITLRMRAVQVIELVSGGGRSYDDLLDEEEGYEGSPSDADSEADDGDGGEEGEGW